jgi:hypothetical protein
MNQDLAQVVVTSVADASTLHLATSRVLLRHESHPSSELSSLVERSAVVDRRHDRRCHQRGIPGIYLTACMPVT